ncbi:hypothetical protein PSN45_004985 [Yamadazyma tenuis]|uniref:uncharacterized protein n=1 Tax=Candida tenuis TaxID=2315449 RepID=UPI00279FD4B7|nr:hypothetical protein PSN45_004985 [Yamadazyma tenuis]
MSNNFLHSSPAGKDTPTTNTVKDQNIDPALYPGSPDGDRRKSRLSTQMSPANFTGWTPLISKTLNNEQLLNYNSTPSSKFLNNILLNSANHNSILPQNDIDYSNGLNLTPFLNHNINLLASNQFATMSSGSNGNTASFTPFHDKTLHLSDFFMESPIKDLGTITPSKFKLGSDIKLSQNLLQDPKSARKRSINELDVVANRPPHKLSITVKANDLTDEEPDEDDNDKENADSKFQYKKSKVMSNLQTPSKVVVLGDRANRKVADKTPSRQRQRPKEFTTPAKPTGNSSPSTVILSSGAKAASNEQSRKFVPNSPTPMANKGSKFTVKVDDIPDVPPKPVMGVFSDAKSMSSKTRRSNSHKSDDNSSSKTSSISRFGTNIQVNNLRFKTSNKAQMQAGMNKFQISLGDGAGSKRGRKGRKAKEKKSSKKEVTVETQAHANGRLTQTQGKSNSHPQQQQSSHENTSVTKDSSLMSGSNNSMNLSNLNVSQGTEHTSFDFGALSSTPNGKFFLDKMFEKPSPQSQQLLNQVLMGQQYNQQPSQASGQSNMPPPKFSHPAPVGGIQTQNSQVMMMMSTPNHPSIYSPHETTGDHHRHHNHNNDHDNDNDEANISLSAFAYNFDRKDSSPKFSSR